MAKIPGPHRIRRRKINLVRKKVGKKNMDGFVWFIGLRQNRKTFYVSDYDDDNNTVIWACNKADGIIFKTERAVHRFIHKHLHGRTDVFLIQAPPV